MNTKTIKEFPQYADIPPVGDFTCPDPDCEESQYSGPCTNKHLIGWCHDGFGYYGIFECQGCFTKYRHHLFHPPQDKSKFFAAYNRQLDRETFSPYPLTRGKKMTLW